MQPWLGTFVEVGAEGGMVAGRAIQAAFDAISTVHELMSFHDPDSDLSRLNNAKGQPVALHPLSVTMLRLARGFMRASQSGFNCTVGGALERLDVLPVLRTVATLECGKADDIVILGRTSARLRRPVHITLDGIAKGFAVDRAVRALQAHGAISGWVNAGGDLRVFGARTLSLACRESTGYRCLGNLANGAAATTVTANRTDPQFPGRVVSPDGHRVANGSWTVLARQAWRADALTKVAALAPAAQRVATIRRLGGELIASASVLQ